MELTTPSLSLDSPGAFLIRRFRDFHENLASGSLLRLEEIYTQDIEVVTPVQRLSGSLALKKYLKLRSIKLQEPRLSFLDALVGEHCAWLSWELELMPRRGTDARRVRGMTHVKFTSRIYYQEDSYDLTPLLIDDLPLLGPLLNARKRRLRV